MPNNRAMPVALKITAAVFSRLLLNTARRFVYPYAPSLSRGLGVPLTAVTGIIAANQAATMLGMLSGPVADRIGYKTMMLTGMGMLVVGACMAGIMPVYAVVFAGLFLAGLGKSIFDPSLQAYLGERVPFHRRGLAVGLIELSWAGSTLIGIPAAGLLIDQYGWRAPFFALAFFGLLGFLAMKLAVDPDKKRSGGRFPVTLLWKEIRGLLRVRSAAGALLFAFFTSMANDNLFVVYGAWLEDAFHLSIVALGLGTTIIGVAELLGEFMTAGLSDRIGLKRSVAVGLLITCVCYGMVPVIGRSLPLALLGLFFLFLSYEFTMVSFLSLNTELSPTSRATMISTFFAAAGLGRVAGAMTGGYIWIYGGVMAIGLFSAAVNFLAFLSIWWGLRHWRAGGAEDAP